MQPRPLGFRQSVQDTVDQASHHDRGDGNHGGGQAVSFEIREDLFLAAVFTELVAVKRQLDAGEVLAPFVVERPVPSPAVRHPETTALENNSVRGAHKPTPPDFPPQPGEPGIPVDPELRTRATGSRRRRRAGMMTFGPKSDKPGSVRKRRAEKSPKIVSAGEDRRLTKRTNFNT